MDKRKVAVGICSVLMLCFFLTTLWLAERLHTEVPKAYDLGWTDGNAKGYLRGSAEISVTSYDKGYAVGRKDGFANGSIETTAYIYNELRDCGILTVSYNNVPVTFSNMRCVLEEYCKW